MSGPDPRLHPVREGLAPRRLEGVTTADAFTEAEAMTVRRLSAAMRAGPDAGAEQVDQLLYGEAFDVLTGEDGWLFGQARRDGYVGWVRQEGLEAGEPTPTHRVAALRTYAMAEPTIRAPSLGVLSMNALVTVEAEEARFLLVAGLGWVAADHLVEVGTFASDPAAVALSFVGAPYHWGGRDGVGIDCSGLVQQSLYACGVACPRDADQQARVGEAITADEGYAGLRRNDLVGWTGHIGLMLDETRLIHANSWHMKVEIEPLVDAVTRMVGLGSAPPAVFRRLPRLPLS